MTKTKTKTPEPDVDLDALRAERLAGVDPPTVQLGGRTWTLVHELPLEVYELHRDGHRRRVVELILANPSEAEHFLSFGPSDADLAALINGAYRGR